MPSLLEPRRRAEEAPVGVVCQAYVETERAKWPFLRGLMARVSQGCPGSPMPMRASAQDAIAPVPATT